MRKFLIPVVGASLLAVSMTSFAFGDRGHCHNPGGFHKMERKMSRVLELSDEQKNAISAIRESYQSEHCEAVGKLWMAELNPSDPDYVNRLEMASDQAAATAKQRVLKMGEMRQKIDAVLTEEQRTKLATVIAEKKQKWQERQLSKR